MGTDNKVKLSVDGLAKNYGPVQALVPTSIDVSEGEFLTLLGPSGSGKTTLLMMVAGLTAPSSGDIWIDGKLSTFLPPHQRDIGVVFQNYALFPHLSVFENIAFPLRMRGLKAEDISAKVSEVLSVVDLSEMAERLPKELSGGQQQRVALARCAVYGPSIILMDEPLGALDKKLRDNMQSEIRRLHKALGSTILYVTHDQGEAMSMSDRICVMRNGAIEQIGSPAELYHYPKNKFVGDFLGGATFIDCTVEKCDTDTIYLKGKMGSFKARNHKHLTMPLDQQAMCMIRPQSIKISSSKLKGMNSLPAKITESILTGTMTEHHTILGDGSKSSAVEITTQDTKTFENNKSVFVNWSENDCVIFSGDELK
ncbi:MAG: ABC transporter ATP-binding protein [Alphaproteobacteria bacterium]|jgi:putative spermidine/putrescine transport system ATP-binding protein